MYSVRRLNVTLNKELRDLLVIKQRRVVVVYRHMAGYD